MKKPEKMTVAEWNEFARNCKTAIIEPAYEFESEEENAEFLARLAEFFGAEPIPEKKQNKRRKLFGRSKIRADREQNRSK